MLSFFISPYGCVTTVLVLTSTHISFVAAFNIGVITHVLNSGIYTINFTTAVPTANYCVNVTLERFGDICIVGTKAVNSFVVSVRDAGSGVMEDSALNISVFHIG